MMSDEPKIERCPFRKCGSEENCLTLDMGDVYWVECLKCCAQGATGKTEKEAIEVWNAASEPARLLEKLDDGTGKYTLLDRYNVDKNGFDWYVTEDMILLSKFMPTPLEALRNAFKDE